MMFLYCPKCNTGYEIKADLIPEKGMKMRCAQCGEVWRCTRDDLIEKQEPIPAPEPEKQIPQTSDSVAEEAPAEETNELQAPTEAEPETSPENAEMSDIFARLSTQTEELFKQEQSVAKPKRMWSKTRHQLGLDCPGTLKYYLFLILLAIVLLLFAVRFELVRAFPVAGKIYDALGIEARVVGDGLEFQNVIRDEYTEDYVRILEIRGYIANTTSQAMDIPLIHVEILDKDTNLLQALNDKAPITRIEADGRIAFRIAIKQPSTLAKYILLTFTKN